MENIVLPNLFCFSEIWFGSRGWGRSGGAGGGGLNLQQHSGALHLSFQNGSVTRATSLSSVCTASCVSLLCVYARAYAIVQSFTLAKGNRAIYSFIRQKRSIQNTYLIFTTPWALENEKLRRRRYTGAQMQFKSSYHQIPALSRLPIDGLSPTLSIMTAGINIDWWAVIMEWLIICSQCGFGPINEAFFSHRMR